MAKSEPVDPQITDAVTSEAPEAVVPQPEEVVVPVDPNSSKDHVSTVNYKFG